MATTKTVLFVPPEKYLTLSHAFNNFQNPRITASQRDEDPSFIRDPTGENLNLCFKRWYKFHIWLEESPASFREEFIASLPQDHLISYTVLVEFFDGGYHDSEDPEALIREELEGEKAKLPDPDSLTYVRTMAFLFDRELSWHTPRLPVSLVASHNMVLRRRAWEHAKAQSIAYSVLSSYKSKLSGIPARAGNVTTQLGSLRWKLGNSAVPILPYYLWDIAQECAVVVSSLTQTPVYTCISHTWGRWETKDTVSLKGVPWAVPGNSRFDVNRLPSLLKTSGITTSHVWLDLACIPQGNHDLPRQAEEIAKQAEIFENAASCIAWWNDVKTWARLYTAVTWLSFQYLRDRSGLPFLEVDGFVQDIEQSADDTSDLFQKLYFPLKSPPASTASSNVDLSWTAEKIAWAHKEICCSRSLVDCPNGLRLQAASSCPTSLSAWAKDLPVPDWLTSLWTLQEACLFPVMVLASASFEFFKTPEGLEITLDGLVSLLSWNKNMTIRSAKQLSLCFPRQFASVNAMTVMLMGNERECSGERAPAIMSVLGVTDWYRAQLPAATQAGGHPTELVLGKYPLAFVQEAAAKIGPLFYSTWGPDCAKKTMGALLPFSDQDDGFGDCPSFSPGFRKHAEHEPWRIVIVGGRCMVLVTAAVILASSNGESRARAWRGETAGAPTTKAQILGFPPEHGKEADLQRLLHALSYLEDGKDAHAFAVLLTQDSGAKIGIILVGCPGTGGMMVLAKKAVFIMKHSKDESHELHSHGTWPEVPEAQNVRWIAG